MLLAKPLNLSFLMLTNVNHLGVPEIDQIITVLMSTSMAVGGLVGLILDNTIPGTTEERGLKAWRQHLSGDSDEQFQTASIKVYDLPFVSIASVTTKWLSICLSCRTTTKIARQQLMWS